MKILITSGNSGLSVELARSLSAEHEVILTDPNQVSGLPSNVQYRQSNLDYDDDLKDIMNGLDAVVHRGLVDVEMSVSEQLDQAMRLTYNLLWAASDNSVPRFVFLSSLSILDQYEESMTVTERWRPTPTTEPVILGYHLGEFVCREFAREGKIEVLCLRLGPLSTVSFERPSTSSLYMKDAIEAIEKAVIVDIGLSGVGARHAGAAAPKSMWNIYHIQSVVPDARYSTAAALSDLGYASGTSG